MLPEKWYIRRTPETAKEINQWFNEGVKQMSYSDDNTCIIFPNKDTGIGFKDGYHVGGTSQLDGLRKRGYVEITFSQFKQITGKIIHPIIY